MTCLACGTALALALASAGSLRCHDCRAEHAPLRADLVEPSTSFEPIIRAIATPFHALPASLDRALAA